MGRKKAHTPEEIFAKLRQAEVLVGQGKTVADPWLRQAIQNEAVRRWGPRQEENTHGR